ncbi:interferon-induced very large GTPase 1-like [Engraulis encrasicolus]|uniref:interferon-induced very large GTPase 1-like n=1 Tax=Engraulis encrasicolus TaxID=184585 RepID=UPI002FD50361
MSYPGVPPGGSDEPDKREASDTPVEEAASESALPPGGPNELERREAVASEEPLPGEDATDKSLPQGNPLGQEEAAASEELQPGTWPQVPGEEERVQSHGDLPGVQAHTADPDMQKRDLQETPEPGTAYTYRTYSLSTYGIRRTNHNKTHSIKMFSLSPVVKSTEESWSSSAQLTKEQSAHTVFCLNIKTMPLNWYAVTWRQVPEQYNRTTSNCQVEVTGLHPREEYHFSVATLSQDGRQSSSVERFIHTEIPVPESLAVSSITGSSARISWKVPSKMQKTPHSFLVSYQREGSEPNYISSKSCNTVITGLTPGTDYTVRVQTELQHGGKSPPASLQIHLGVPLSDLLSAVGLSNLQGGKLTLSSVLEINSNMLCDTPAQGSQQLSWLFLKKLMMSNLNARNLQCDQLMHMSSSTNVTEDSYDAMNPLDLITALFHCADPFLQQEIVSKMFMCQFAVPLLLPNCDTQQSTLMLWAMRDLVKNYKAHYSSEGRIVEMEIAMVSFVRVGESSLYKSQTLNKLISNSSQPNEPFIHHDMPCGDVPRRISDGLVEVSWYLPCGNKNIDIFTQPVAVANLRGDSRSFEAQVSFLCQTSAAVFIFTDDPEGDLSPFTNTKRKAELFLVTNSQRKDIVDELKKTCRQHKLKEDHVIMRTNQNESDFVKILRLLVKNIVESNVVKTNMITFTSTARQIGILVDEDSSGCQNAKQNVEGISEMVKNVVAFKEEQLPLHGTIWKEISQLEKERYRLRKANRDQGIQHYTSALDTQEQELRKQQHQRDISDAMANFIAGISQSNKESLYFLKWLKIQLDTVSRNNLSTLRQLYKDCCRKNLQDNELIKMLDEQISNCLLGPEHFFRELGQIYECACSLTQDNPARQQVQHLPRLCAQMLLDGFPVELVDGDASNIPMKWISAVLTELHQLVDKKSRILVLTVLGVQSTGKSTLLNTMFGVQFAVSSGRCTRGAFMLLIKVSEELISELKCDFIMVIDTEGLMSPELAALDISSEHDNELATLVIGLSDITIINVAMENSIEMKDVLQIAVHAFLRMKEAGKKRRCLFVHQNVSDMSAHDNNKRDRNKLVDQLNEMTWAAATMEKKAANTKFTDVMKYDPDKDSYYIPGLWHGTPPMAPVSTGYSETVYELKKSLLGLLQSDEIICNDAVKFQKWTESLWKSVKFENFIFNFRNSLVADAYSDVCTEYNSWEWTFQTEMNSWRVAKTTVISNCGLTEKNVNISELQTQVRDMLHEASVKLDKELQTIKDNIEKYFQQKDNKVHLVEKYKQDFHTSATTLRQQTWHSVRQCLEQAVEIRKGMEKVNTIKDKQRKTIETKVLELIKQCHGRGTDLSEDDVKEEFDKMWREGMSELSNVDLQQTDVHQHALHLLKENLREKSGCVSEILSQVDLKTSGQGEFTVKEDCVDMDQFITNLTDLIKDMEISVAQEYDMRASRTHITEIIEQLAPKPHDLLFSSLCGCGHQCPFCKTPCEAGVLGHTTHFSNMHRPRAFGRYTCHDSKKLIADICTTAVLSDGRFSGPDTNWDWIPYKEYKETYPDWDIAGDASIEASDYWKYVMKEFNRELANYYNAEPADIPDEWKALTKQDALTSLKKAFKM